MSSLPLPGLPTGTPVTDSSGNMSKPWIDRLQKLFAQPPSQALQIVSVKDPAYGAAGDGSSDDTKAVQSAINAVAAGGGGAVYMPAGTYRISATLNGASNVTLYGDGMGATTINQTTSADAILFFDVTRFGLRGLTINAPAGNAIHVIAKATNPLYPMFDEVEITAIGSASTGILFETQGLVDIFFPSFRNVVVNGGSPAPNVGTRTGIAFITSSGTGSGTVGPQIFGGRVLNVQTGFYLTSAVGSVTAYGVAFDGITTNNSGTGTGIAIHFLAGTGVNFFRDTRFESNPAIDTYLVFDSGCADNLVTGTLASILPNLIIDNGIRNSWWGADGSGGPPNSKINYPIDWEGVQNFKNAANFAIGLGWTGTAAGPVPATNNALNIGTPLTSTQLAGGNAAAQITAPNSNWGFPLLLQSDSSNRGLQVVGQGFNATTGTGTALNLYADGHLIASTAGGATGAPVGIGGAGLRVDGYNGSSSFADAVTIAGYLSATTTWNPGSIAAGAVASTSVTLTDAAATDIAMATLSTIGANNLLISAQPGAGVVYVTIHNPTAGAINPGSGTLRVSCIKH